MRNEIVLQFQETVEKTLIEFQKKLNDFKAEIALDNNKLVAANNELLRSMTIFERKIMNKSIKGLDNKEEKMKSLRGLKDSLKSLNHFS